jgi:putative ABC transport system substrate-binding protein
MAIHVGRREFLFTLSGATAAWPLAARAQQAGKLPTIGFLGSSSASDWSQWTAAFIQRLHELGWIEGRTVTIEYRWADGRSERFAEIAAEFVRLKVDVIVTSGLAVPATKEVTSVIPIVFAVATDPVGTGIIASLARPGGNVTGLSQQSRELAGKRLELLREIVPALHRLAAMGNVGSPGFALEIGDLQVAARALGLDVAAFEIRRGEDIVPAFASIKDHADALYVIGSDPLIVTKRVAISTLAAAARLPTVHSTREYVEAGGLLSYGPNYADLFWRAGNYVDKILRGAKPGDLPVEQPTKFDLVVNLTTAKALGLTIPESFLLRANEVIE